MPDLRTVLTETLAHTLRIHPYGPDLQYGFSEYANRIATELADQVLGLPGVAVTQLPEPERPWAQFDAWAADESYVVVAAHGAVLLEDDETVTSLPPAIAIRLAERLLAAAVSVEGNTSREPAEENPDA